MIEPWLPAPGNQDGKAVPNATSGYDGGKTIKGRKRHVALYTGGLLLAVVVTIGSPQGRDGAHQLAVRLRAAFSTQCLPMGRLWPTHSCG
jgi:hypothetical protein